MEPNSTKEVWKLGLNKTALIPVVILGVGYLVKQIRIRKLLRQRKDPKWRKTSDTGEEGRTEDFISKSDGNTEMCMMIYSCWDVSPKWRWREYICMAKPYNRRQNVRPRSGWYEQVREYLETLVARNWKNIVILLRYRWRKLLYDLDVYIRCPLGLIWQDKKRQLLCCWFCNTK